MDEVRLTPEELYRWMAEFARTARTLRRSKLGTAQERMEVVGEYINANDELLRLSEEAGL